MLRGRQDDARPPGTGASNSRQTAQAAAGFPGIDQPYATDERPMGILFYWARESRYLPYPLLQSMRCQDGELKLAFAQDEVVITGRGLHELYVQLAAHRVWRIVEQGERYAAICNTVVFIAAVQWIRRSRESQHRVTNPD